MQNKVNKQKIESDRSILQQNFTAMKRIVLLSVLILAFSAASFARKFVAEGTTNSVLGNYRIEVDDSYITLNGREHKPFVITYGNTGLVVRVAVDMDRNCKKYYALSDNLSVQYVCSRKFFGVEMLDKSLEKDGFKTDEKALNRDQYFHQKVLRQSPGTMIENAKLIAIFYPMLLNSFDNNLVTR
jgi:hypothetical protein